MNTLHSFRSTLIVVALCTSSIDADACGEVLSRTGNALRYHSFVSRHPAEILVYSGPASRANSPGDAARFRENLERAGHRVVLIDDAEALPAAFAEHQFDVVITYAADLGSVTTQIAQIAREPTLIPVVQRGSSDERELRARYPRLLTQNANLNQFLKSIEQTMKARGA